MGFNSRALFQERIVTEYRIDFEQPVATAETARERAHIGERHEQVLAHREQGRRRAHPRCVDIEQIDRFAERQKRFWTVLLYVAVAAGE